MDTIAPPDALIALHAGAGLLAMLAPLVAILTPKPLSAKGIPQPGKWLHRGSGLLYVLAMLVLSVTAIPLAFYQWNSILLVILFLSFYLTASAVLEVRLPGTSWPKDALAVGLLAGAGVVTIMSLATDELAISILTTVFALVAAVLSVCDLARIFRSPAIGVRGWLVSHMVRMLASFTLTVTVYSILNFEAVAMVWRCVLPIAAGGLLSTALMSFYLRSARKVG